MDTKTRKKIEELFQKIKRAQTAIDILTSDLTDEFDILTYEQQNEKTGQDLEKLIWHLENSSEYLTDAIDELNQIS